MWGEVGGEEAGGLGVGRVCWFVVIYSLVLGACLFIGALDIGLWKTSLGPTHPQHPSSRGAFTLDTLASVLGSCDHVVVSCQWDDTDVME